MAGKRRKQTEYQETSFWQSYSDMMAGVLLVFILIICGTLFVLMQVKNSYDASELELQERKEELEQAIQENLGYIDLTDAQRALLAEQQQTLDEQQSQLNEQQLTLEEQQARLAQQQADLEAAQALLAQQQADLEASQTLLSLQQTQLEEKEVQISLQKEQLATQTLQLEEIIGVKKDLIAELRDEFANSDLSISIDEQTGSIMLESSVMFAYDSDALSSTGKNTLSSFLPAYFDVVLSDAYIDYVSEIIIEGHTDTTGSYEYNLELSQARAAAVAEYCLGNSQTLFSSSRAERIRSIVSVVGRSWSDPIYNADGTVNAEASRRVVVKFRLSDDEMINELLDVLEQYEP